MSDISLISQTTNNLTPDVLSKLIPIFKEKTGNCNILFAMLMSQSLNFCLFGGTLRDYFRKVKSNDIDILMQYDLNLATIYNTKTRKFYDLLFEKLKNIFGEYIKISKSELKKTNVVVKNKSEYIVDTQNEEETYDLDIIEDEPDLDMYVIENDHIEYQLVFGDESFKLDISFVDDLNNKSNLDNASCIEDTLYIKFNNTTTSEINFSDDPEKIFLEVDKFIRSNIKTFDDSFKDNTEFITNNCAKNFITIKNIDTFKRVMKIVRFFDESCHIRSLVPYEEIKKKLVDYTSYRKNKNSYEDKKKICKMLDFFEKNHLPKTSFSSSVSLGKKMSPDEIKKITKTRNPAVSYKSALMTK